jgi:hypothetical protein
MDQDIGAVECGRGTALGNVIKVVVPTGLRMADQSADLESSCGQPIGDN